MAKYTFRVNLPHRGEHDYYVDVDENRPLNEVFARIILQSQDSELPIPYEIETADGQMREIEWGFSLVEEEEDGEGEGTELSAHQSLAEQGVLPGSLIHATDTMLPA